MLEYALNYLHAELTMANPEHTETYDKLRTSADILREARTQHISEKEFESLSNKFDQSVGDELARQYKNTGKLLVASVVDDQNGIKGAVSAFKEWVADEARFSKQWITTVEDILQHALEMTSNPNQ